MAWARWAATVLAAVEGAYMVVDGGRALVRGDYITPKSDAYAGQLGPWGRLVRAVGIDPRSTVMKSIFVVYGVIWLAVVGVYLSGAPWGGAAMVAAAIGSLWYLVFGTATSVLVIVLVVAAGAG